MSSPFLITNYVRAGITSNQFTVGGVSSISGIVDYKNATMTGGYTVSQTVSYAPGTYTFWGFTETQMSGYWPAGSATVTVLGDTFDWTYAGLNASGSPVLGTAKISGYGVYVTADEWNELVDLVNDAGGTSISHVLTGQAISAATVNQVASVLGVSTVSAGATISASFFNELRTAYNNF